ncbi:MAG TPA: GntR family transcriptional regulator, partial [Spirochaetia bacterium]|nr:GntR family transcriptional regulator [Spirochaetia bacterium]
MRGTGPTQVDRVYQQFKQDLFDFVLLPGDRFTETEVGHRLEASRTPVREALFRLAQEGYLQMKSRAGWMVKPFEFRQFQELYDLRSLLETGSIRR